MSALDHVHLPDGRRLDVRVTGPGYGLPLVFHHGTPGALCAPTSSGRPNRSGR